MDLRESDRIADAPQDDAQGVPGRQRLAAGGEEEHPLPLTAEPVDVVAKRRGCCVTDADPALLLPVGGQNSIEPVRSGCPRFTSQADGVFVSHRVVA